MKIIYKIILFLLLPIVLVGCTEPYALQTNKFQDALVVEATITNELKTQEIKISRTYKFEETGPISETGANVSVTDNLGTTYDFNEVDGVYKSTSPFQAMPGVQYQLKITTSNGRVYNSTQKTLTTAVDMENVVPTVITNTEGERGVEIRVNSFDPTNSSKYYRYEYQETAKVTAPMWHSVYAKVVPADSDEPNNPHIHLFPRTEEARICYTPEISTSIILNNTVDLTEDRVENFPIKFLNQNDYTIAERYSILVKQYVESLESYNYYKNIRDLAATGEILSPSQPGFTIGNIYSVNNPSEKVVGFFNVTSVSERRIFFNYHDLFPGESYPPYFDPCEKYEFLYCFNGEGCAGEVLNGMVIFKSMIYWEIIGSNYIFIKPVCGDCTSFSSNIRPSFWID